MKKYLIILCMTLLTAFAAFAQTPGVTRKGGVTTEKGAGTVDRNGQVVPCPALTQYGQVIDYTATIEPFGAQLEGTVDIALSITVTSIGNADSVGFELATDTNFTNIVGRKMHTPVALQQYRDTFKGLDPGVKYFVRAYIANCPGTVYSDTIPITTTGLYDITFFAHGGTGTMEAQTFTHGVAQNLTANGFSRDNADFAGWSTDPSGCGTLYADQASMTFYSPDSLYAQWRTWCTGTLAGNESGVSASNRIDSVKDHQGNWYKVVQIGTQCWLKENMRCTTSPSTDNTIVLGGPTAYLQSLTSKCAINHTDSKYGVLYNWCAAVDTFYAAGGKPELANASGGSDNTTKWSCTMPTGNRRGICPEGWHIPKNEEWTNMASAAGVGLNSGTGLSKLSGGCVWPTYTSGTYPGSYSDSLRNSTGFTALPAGGSTSTSISNVGQRADFWSATVSEAGKASGWYIYQEREYLSTSNSWWLGAHAVRCVRDAEVTDTITFNANNGTSTMPNQTAVRGVKVKLNSNQFTRTGSFEFAGWNTDRSGCGTSYADGDSITLSGNVTLYAQWNTYCTGTPLTNEVSYETNRIDSVKDHQSNSYSVVTINGICIMKQNLRVTSSPNPSHTLSSWGSSPTTASYYIQNPTFGNEGYLYNWRAALDTTINVSSIGSDVDIPNRRGLCPQGWHLPTRSEWTSIVGSHDAGQFAADNGSYTGTNWSSSSTANTPGYTSDPDRNATGFSGVPVGGYGGGNLFNVGSSATFWSAASLNNSKAYNRYLSYNNSSFYEDNDIGKGDGRSVRCVRNTPVPATISFNANGGTGTMPAMNVTTMRDTVLDANNSQITHTGNWEFAGWNTKRDGSGTAYADGAHITPTESITLYAQWNTYCTGTVAANESGISHIDSVKDHQNNWYKVVEINGICIMKENLRVDNSTPTPSGKTLTDAVAMSGSQMNYGYKEIFGKNGYLYSWYAMTDSAAQITSMDSYRRGLCPAGWHIPSTSEWQTVFAGYNAGNFAAYNDAFVGTNWTVSTTADQPGNVNDPDKDATGFSAIPTGYKQNVTVTNAGDGQSAIFWTSTIYNAGGANHYKITYNNNGFVLSTEPSKCYQHSVRCVRDVKDTITFVPNGGTGTMQKQIVPRGVTTALSPNGYTHAGNWVFAGWNNDCDGNGITYADQAYITTTGNVTLYAQWHTYCDGNPITGEGGTDRIDSVKDHQNNWYKVVQIGTGDNAQCWLKENMRCTTNKLGVDIVQPSPSGGSTTEPRAYYPNNYAGNYAKYGCLYNHPAAKVICPDGWQLPSAVEWDQMISAAGTSVTEFSGKGLGKLAGGCDWVSNGVETAPGNYTYPDRNSSGFTALPAGEYYGDGFFKYFQTDFFFWTSTQGSVGAYNRSGGHIYEYVGVHDSSCALGYSVRCIRIKPQSVTIRFNGNGGSGSISDMNVRTLDNVTLPGSGFSHDGSWELIGWNDASDGKGTFYPLGSTFTVTGALTLYAQWHTYCTGTPNSGNEGGTSRIDSVKDHEENWYKVVQIGSYCWLKENMKCTTLPNGNSLQFNTNSASSTEARAYYPNGNEDNRAKFGCLYNIPAAIAICPEGWHLSTEAEWTDMFAAAGVTTSTGLGKITGGTDWQTYGSGQQTCPGNYSYSERNSSGFTALPAGRYYVDGSNKNYDCFTTDFIFWTARHDASNAKDRTGGNRYEGFGEHNRPRSNGHSVRCVRNN